MESFTEDSSFCCQIKKVSLHFSTSHFGFWIQNKCDVEKTQVVENSITNQRNIVNTQKIIKK